MMEVTEMIFSGKHGILKKGKLQEGVTMKISTIQMTINEQDPADNLNLAMSLLKKHSSCEGRTDGEGKTDIYVLPEMFTCGYDFTTWEMAASVTPQAMKALRDFTRNNDCAISASLPFRDENDKFFNRMIFIGSSGELVASYDKVHLFAPMGEDLHVTAGDSLATFSYKGWRLSLLVCFDLRYPVPFYRCALDGSEIFLMCAEWPFSRIETMEVLCRARAIETQSYLVMANRTGTAFDNQLFGGHSMIVDPLGDFVCAPPEGNTVVSHVCNKELLTRTRERINVFAGRSLILDL
jgi:predicted amidohydrolase